MGPVLPGQVLGVGDGLLERGERGGLSGQGVRCALLFGGVRRSPGRWPPGERTSGPPPPREDGSSSRWRRRRWSRTGYRERGGLRGTAWMLSTPARCPSRRGKPRCVAHRPFPSMIMATCRGTGWPELVVGLDSSLSCIEFPAVGSRAGPGSARPVYRERVRLRSPLSRLPWFRGPCPSDGRGRRWPSEAGPAPCGSHPGR